MKKLLLIIISLSILACAKDNLDSPQGSTSDTPSTKIINPSEGALAGVITIEVTSELADRIEATNAQRTRSGETITRAGISDMDLVFTKIGVEHFARTFPYEERFEERHRAFGLHQMVYAPLRHH